MNPKDRRVLVCENTFWPANFKFALAQALFEYDVPALLFLPSLILPLYTTKMRAGLVVDIGARETRVLPVCWVIIE